MELTVQEKATERAKNVWRDGATIKAPRKQAERFRRRAKERSKIAKL
jgi:hypothetical protein